MITGLHAGARVPDGQGAAAGLRRGAARQLLRRLPRDVHAFISVRPSRRGREEDGDRLGQAARQEATRAAAHANDAGCGTSAAPSAYACAPTTPVLPALQPLRPAPLPRPPPV
jgi:hypothetical protein